MTRPSSARLTGVLSSSEREWDSGRSRQDRDWSQRSWKDFTLPTLPTRRKSRRYHRPLKQSSRKKKRLLRRTTTGTPPPRPLSDIPSRAHTPIVSGTTTRLLRRSICGITSRQFTAISPDQSRHLLPPVDMEAAKTPSPRAQSPPHTTKNYPVASI